jgi:hypothetical protein
MSKNYEKRDKQIVVRITQSEKEKIERLYPNTNLSEYIRNILLNGGPSYEK